MKRKLFQLFNLLMTCVVLLSSTGFGLVEHSCQMRGKKKTMVVAFSDHKKKTGCSSDGQSVESRQTTVDKASCCQDESSYENVDAQSSLSQLVAKFVKAVTETVLAGTVALLTGSRRPLPSLVNPLPPPGAIYWRSTVGYSFDLLIDFTTPMS